MADQTVAVRYVVTITEDEEPFAEQIKGNYFKPGDDYSAEQKDEFLADCGADGQKYADLAGW